MGFPQEPGGAGSAAFHRPLRRFEHIVLAKRAGTLFDPLRGMLRRGSWVPGAKTVGASRSGLEKARFLTVQTLATPQPAATPNDFLLLPCTDWRIHCFGKDWLGYGTDCYRILKRQEWTENRQGPMKEKQPYASWSGCRRALLRQAETDSGSWSVSTITNLRSRNLGIC